MANNPELACYELQAPGDPPSLFVIRELTTLMANRAGLDSLDASKVKIAVDDACSNVLEHASRGLDPEPQPATPGQEDGVRQPS